MTDVAVADAVDAYLQRKARGDPDGPGAGTYAANAESVLRRWVEWLAEERGIRSVFDLAPDHMRAYAEELRDRTESGAYAPSTAGTYYAVVRAFLSWCVRGGILEANPAADETATAALPVTIEGDAGEGWSAERRRTLERHVRERAIEASSDGFDREERCGRLREYALVALLVYSDVRGSELFRVPRDDRRTGAVWEDVDFYTGTIRVLGRSQRLEEVPLPAPVRTPLRRYRVALDPPANDWPLFPTRHAPSIARRVRDVLAERGHEEGEIESIMDESTATELARERAIAPPAITTEGARSVLRRLCEDAGVAGEESPTPRDLRGDRPVGYRREASGSSPALRATVLEQTIAVPQRRPVFEVVDAREDEESN
ncbi:recombinase XerD [Natronococcus sp. A-GB7]|uniref:tyrosine-type recombinase/integrase n=1 Tax=Natronococcus sp. A-GB7 TaxID=3037649 RepID=UPI00241DA6F6|nr:recombinase XerD [Natronococcus sp. A-GB7]MDG5820932.1 recombinase XerD [Natronococcus sp. A-GB7]